MDIQKIFVLWQLILLMPLHNDLIKGPNNPVDGFGIGVLGEESFLECHGLSGDWQVNFHSTTIVRNELIRED
jgi:hypothetical protein